MYYFASDVHLGSMSRELDRRFVAWLDRVSVDAEAIFLCGDIFDFWFEYKRAVPKGFVRVLGRIAELTDRGVRVVFMTGNHDMWLRDYLAEECGMELYSAPERFLLGGNLVHVAHGDNLNVFGDWKLKMLNGVFRSRWAYSLFSKLIHPNLMLQFGQWWSGESRKSHRNSKLDNTIDGYGVRALLEYAERQQRDVMPCDYYVYGHLHQCFEYDGGDYRVFFMNDWAEEPYYIKLDNDGVMSLEKV